MFDFLRPNSMPAVHVNDMDSLIGKVEIIDIREPYEVASGKLKTARNVPMMTLINSPDKYMKKDKKYYIICQSGGRSRSACKALASQGYDVVNVAGGMGSYLGKNRV